MEFIFYFLTIDHKLDRGPFIMSNKKLLLHENAFIYVNIFNQM